MPADNYTSQPSANPALDGAITEIAIYTSEAMALLAVFSLLVVRNSLKKQIDYLKRLLKPTQKLVLDLCQENKAKLCVLLENLRVESQADNVCLGILYNGQISEWGYSFSKVNFELEAYNPRVAPISPKLSKIPVSFWLQTLNDGQPRWHVEKDWLFYPIYYGPILIAIVVVACYDSTELTKINLENCQTEIDLIRSILATFVTREAHKAV